MASLGLSELRIMKEYAVYQERENTDSPPHLCK